MAWLLSLVLMVALYPSKSQFEGRVVTESGSPIPGASVLLVRKGAPEVEVGNLTGTDATGLFHLKATPDALFVQKAGYVPVLYRLDGVRQSPLVVMKVAAPERAAALPHCSDIQPGQHLLPAGMWTRIITTETIKVDESHGIDTAFTEVFYPGKRHLSMTIASGMVGIGHPNIEALASTDAIVVHETLDGLDISGVTDHGKHWRWAFINHSHIEYYGASPQAAEFFDRLIGSMCSTLKPVDASSP